jgi:glycosyltransferase involved in cell wall biosynthesis
MRRGMKVLIIAPRICTPWTEGRKKFVCDLIAAASTRWQLRGLITVDPGESTQLPPGFDAHTVSSTGEHLFYLTGNLKRAIAQHEPDLVCHFPFGTFSGLRGLGNLWAIASIARTCRNAGVQCCTIMYSLTADANTPLHRLLLKDVHFNQYVGGKDGIRFGVRLAPSTDEFHDKSTRTLLFMSGAAEANSGTLDYVLDVRGLRYLLKAGAALSQQFRLIVAIPFLRSPEMLERLRCHPDNRWNGGSIEFRPEVALPEVFRGISAFVFPYGQEEKQFVPTSIVEAMHFGIPVVLPRLNFLAQFCSGTPKALVHEPRDVDSLVAQIARLDDEAGNVDAMRRHAAAFVDAEYSIANSVGDIELLYRKPAGTSVAG